MELKVVKAHSGETSSPHYTAGETVPVHRGLAGPWEQQVFRTAKGGTKRVVRPLYELRTLDALCDQLNCKGVWVEGADEFRNPDEDLQPDLAGRRFEHCSTLAKPLDATEFIAELCAEHEAELAAFEAALAGLDFVEIAARGKDGAIKLTHLDAVPEPRNLTALKQAIVQRWGMVALIDALKEAVLRSPCRSTIAALVGKEKVDEQFLERILLCLYAYGTNTGVRAAANAGAHGHTEKQLYYLVHRYRTPELAQALAVDIANATFGVRQRAATHARSLHERGDVLITAVVRDALAASIDWWDLGEHLGLHPQEAYERYRSACEGLRTPAQQPPELAVVITAGVVA